MLKVGPEFLQFKVYVIKGWLLPNALQEYLLAKYSVMLNIKTDWGESEIAWL